MSPLRPRFALRAMASLVAAFGLAGSLAACSGEGAGPGANDTPGTPSPDGADVPDGGNVPGPHTPRDGGAPARRLSLARESKLAALFGGGKDYEASGVAVKDGELFVVFDNREAVGRVPVSLASGTLSKRSGKNSQYEGITVRGESASNANASSTNASTFYAVVEMASKKDPRAQIVTLDQGGDVLATEWVEPAFRGDKGLEGIAWLTVAGQERLLALCEAGGCDDTTSSRTGTLRLLSRAADGVWRPERTVELPKSVSFTDYADIALRPIEGATDKYEVAVVSQQSSALFLGTLSTSTFAFEGDGEVLSFPRAPSGQYAYCNVEGVTFLDATTLAFVSDKTNDDARCEAAAESVHVFELR